MTKFAYNGDHPQVTTWGVTFPRGVPVEVEHPMLLQKLPGNSDFTQVDEAVSSGTAPAEGAAIEGMSKAELKVALDAKGIAYPANANKETLAALLGDAGDLA